MPDTQTAVIQRIEGKHEGDLLSFASRFRVNRLYRTELRCNLLRCTLELAPGLVCILIKDIKCDRSLVPSKPTIGGFFVPLADYT